MFKLIKWTLIAGVATVGTGFLLFAGIWAGKEQGTCLAAGALRAPRPARRSKR